MSVFVQHPGLYFVAATLLPLASFVLILLSKFVWGVLRPYRDNPAVAPAYKLFGGDKPGPTAAYVALGAIGLAFVLSLAGFLQYDAAHSKTRRVTKEYEHHISDLTKRQKVVVEALAAARRDDKPTAALTKERDALQKEIHAEEEQLRLAQARAPHGWAGHVDWARVRPAGLAESGRATVLQLGYYIDYLSALMFVMVTFIATLIHLFSIGYMSEERAETVEDHQVDAVGHHFAHAEEHPEADHGSHGHHLRRRGRFGRFFMYLSLFCFSMLNLVLADNLFQVFVSWELVGVCSYLLIGFYYERSSAANAANKAFITNRVGDAGYILGLLIVWTYLGTFNFQDVFKQIRAPQRDTHHETAFADQVVRAEVVREAADGKGQTLRITTGDKGAEKPGGQVVLWPVTPPPKYHAPHAGDEIEVRRDAAPDQSRFKDDKAETGEHGSMPYWMLVAAGLGIFLGCVGKSAQFPLQVWLPDAMEGPTPVSALIHAATMVAAGVYLVGRCYPLLTTEALLVIAYTGGITLFVAATIAVVMTDIKKVLAYSTVSQLGYMMLALGVGGWIAGLFHLLTHAFFKALLFLGSGSVIYGCHHEQEMTKMGGLYSKMKITALTMLAGCLAIAGIPFFSGWYSKDSILAQALGYVSVHPQHLLLFVLPLATAGLTTFYMFRMWFMTFTGEPRDHHVHEHAHESPWPMTVPLIVLAVCSVVVGWGWPLHDAQASHVHHLLAGAQPASVDAEFGASHHGEGSHGHETHGPSKGEVTVAHQAHEYHGLAGALALGVVGIGIVFASLLYFNRVLDPAQAKEEFPRVHAFLAHKWYFDELYSAVVVRPALQVARWFRAFDLGVIDGVLHGVARATVRVTRWGGRFDNGVIDGLVNLTGNVIFAVGARLRGVQTGMLRQYVLFLVLAAVGIFVALSYFVAVAVAG